MVMLYHLLHQLIVDDKPRWGQVKELNYIDLYPFFLYLSFRGIQYRGHDKTS